MPSVFPSHSFIVGPAGKVRVCPGLAGVLHARVVSIVRMCAWGRRLERMYRVGDWGLLWLLVHFDDPFLNVGAGVCCFRLLSPPATSLSAFGGRDTAYALYTYVFVSLQKRRHANSRSKVYTAP